MEATKRPSDGRSVASTKYDLDLIETSPTYFARELGFIETSSTSINWELGFIETSTSYVA